MEMRRCNCGMDLLEVGFFTYGWIETKFVTEGIQFELSDLHVDLDNCCTAYFCNHCLGLIDEDTSYKLAPYYNDLEKRVNDLTINTEGLSKPKIGCHRQKYSCSSSPDSGNSYYTSYRITFSDLITNKCTRFKIERDDPFFREVLFYSDEDIQRFKETANARGLIWLENNIKKWKSVITELYITQSPEQVYPYSCVECNEPVKFGTLIEDVVYLLEDCLNESNEKYHED